MIVITGGAVFIVSARIWELNRQGRRDIIVVDNLASTAKWRNLVGLAYHRYIHKDEFPALARTRYMEGRIEAVIHLGACSATTEPDCDYLIRNNLEYSKAMCQRPIHLRQLRRHLRRRRPRVRRFRQGSGRPATAEHVRLLQASL